MFLKNIYDRIKDPINFIGSLITVLTTVYWIFVFFDINQAKSMLIKANELNILFRIGILLILIASLYFLLEKIYSDAKYAIESVKYQKDLNNLSENNASSFVIDDYGKIIPPQKIINEIYSEFYDQAKKWSNDSYLGDSNLIINTKTIPIQMNLSFTFFSGKKKLSLKLEAISLKIQKNKVIRPEQLTCDEYRVPLKPFFIEKKWRSFVRHSFETIERDIAGRNFYMNLDVMAGNVVFFYLDADFIPRKPFCFYLKNGNMYKDFSLKTLVCKL